MSSERYREDRQALGLQLGLGNDVTAVRPVASRHLAVRGGTRSQAVRSNGKLYQVFASYSVLSLTRNYAFSRH